MTPICPLLFCFLLYATNMRIVICDLFLSFASNRCRSVSVVGTFVTVGIKNDQIPKLSIIICKYVNGYVLVREKHKIKLVKIS